MCMNVICGDNDCIYVYRKNKTIQNGTKKFHNFDSKGSKMKSRGRKEFTTICPDNISAKVDQEEETREKVHKTKREAEKLLSVVSREKKANSITEPRSLPN